MNGIARSTRAIVAAAVVLAALTVALASASGDTPSYGGALDPTFGTGGLASTSLTDLGFPTGSILSTAVQPDGKVLVAGTLGTTPGGYPILGWVIARYNADGSPDTSFGTNGLVTALPQPNCAGSSSSIRSVLAEPDGKILALGFACGFVLAQYNPDGSLDQSFGVGGVVTYSQTASYASVSANGKGLLEPDGKILLLLSPVDSGPFNLWNGGVARLNADGTVDDTFGTSGVGRVPAFSNDCACYDTFDAIGQAADGSIFVGGHRVFQPVGAPDANALFAAHFGSNGNLDTGYGSGGVTVTQQEGGQYGGAPSVMAVQPDGSVVLGTLYEVPGTGSSAWLVGLSADGTLDPTFGTDGTEITTPPGTTADPALYDVRTLLPQPNGKFIVVGDGDFGPPWHDDGLGLARYMPDGSPDTSFGINGAVVITYGSDSIWTYRTEPAEATVAPDGKIVVAGYGATPASTEAWLLMRYLPDGSTPVTVTEAGTGTGTVSSAPNGIECKGTYHCSGQFADQSQVTLTATPSAGAKVSWNGACPDGVLTCQVTAGPGTPQVNVTFAKLSSPCVVPAVTKKLLAVAETAILASGCTVGTVTLARSTKVKAGRIIAETPRAKTRAAAGTPVALVVSKGKHR